jgi:hypothetical protein
VTQATHGETNVEVPAGEAGRALRLDVPGLVGHRETQPEARGIAVREGETAAGTCQIGRKPALVIGMTGPRRKARLGSVERRLLGVAAETGANRATRTGRHRGIELAKLADEGAVHSTNVTETARCDGPRCATRNVAATVMHVTMRIVPVPIMMVVMDMAVPTSRLHLVRMPQQNERKRKRSDNAVSHQVTSEVGFGRLDRRPQPMGG